MTIGISTLKQRNGVGCSILFHSMIITKIISLSANPQKIVKPTQTIRRLSLKGLHLHKYHLVKIKRPGQGAPHCLQFYSLTLSLNPFQTSVACYTPWKHQKTFRFSDVFRGYRNATLGWNGLTYFSELYLSKYRDSSVPLTTDNNEHHLNTLMHVYSKLPVACFSYRICR